MMPRCQKGAIDIELYGTENMLLNKKYKDKYYADSGKIYKCIRDDSNGQGTILHYVPSQLVGIYFEEVKK